MLLIDSSKTVAGHIGGGDRVSLPPWVGDLFGPGGLRNITDGPVRIERRETQGYRLSQLTLHEARAMETEELEAATERAYAAIFDELGRRGGHPVRFWNFVPGIHDAMGGGRDRYMVFNAGRFNAFERRYGGRQMFDQNLATASAVGYGGRDLVIACLTSDTPSEPVDNPRQIKPYHYSRRFGPLPPCFARATILRPADGAPTLLTGGTASIRGEESVHRGDLEGQLQETFRNLDTLLHEAAARCGTGDIEPASSLHYHEFRIYHPDPEHEQPLRRLIKQARPDLQRLEMVNMDLCRSELLVEIEGVATLHPRR